MFRTIIYHRYYCSDALYSTHIASDYSHTHDYPVFGQFAIFKRFPQ